MRQYRAMNDEQDGYRAFLTSDEEETLIAFAVWLEANSIGYTDDVAAAVEKEAFTVWTEWITDPSKAILLKLTWGGK